MKPPILNKMSKKTAVTWMIDKIINKQNGTFDGFPVLSLDEIFEQAKEMEKEQIIHDYLAGFVAPLIMKTYKGLSVDEIKVEITKDAEEYYNETYKKDK